MSPIRPARSRRTFLKHAGLFIGGSYAGLFAKSAEAFQRAPGIIRRDGQRASIAQGVQSGDVLRDRAIIWGRTDRPARMVVEYDTTDRFLNVRRVRGPEALAATDFTSRVELTGLPPGQDIFYRVRYESPGDARASSEPVVGHLRTAPAAPRDIRFLWSGDTCGHGFGINPEWGGIRIFETMRQCRPDFFIHSGDTIYADHPIQAERTTENGRIWKSVVTEAKSKVAETLDEFRGNFLYNLLDDNVRRFNAEVPQIWQWDDHNLLDNWSSGTDLSADARFTEKRVDVLSSRAARAFVEFAPMRPPAADETQRVYRRVPYGPLLDVFVLDMRSYRGPNSYNRQQTLGPQSAFLGAAQIDWLVRELRRSRATWKVIAADMPLGLPVADGTDADGRPRFDAVANGDGPALGRELEIAQVLRAIKRHGVTNVVWLTADVHYTAANYYDPAKAQCTDFDPFWEFVSGPLQAAGTGGPRPPDNTFGLEVVYQRWAGVASASPFLGALFFGEVNIDARTRALTVALKDVENVSHFTKTLAPTSL